MTFAEMTDSEDWIMRPVVEGLCRYESLKDGSLDLEDVARMNDAISVKHENEKRFREANQE